MVFAVGACSTGDPSFPTSPVDAPVPVVPAYAHPLNIGFMMRGYFYAGSTRSEGLGGNARSDNLPRPISELRDVLTASDGLHVLALVDQPRTFAGKYDGFRVIVANASHKPLMFNAQDSRLAIVQEALDPHATWQPIEYLPSSWCGNSYHRLELPARSYWEFTAPHYDGDFTTRLRIRVQIDDGDDTHFTYSDEFPARINRAQFTNEQGHTATNIMDPYAD